MSKWLALVTSVIAVISLITFIYLSKPPEEQLEEFEYPSKEDVIGGRIVGFALTYWTSVDLQLVEKAVKRVKEVNSKWVAVLAFCRQTSRESDQVYVRDADFKLASQIAEIAKKAELKVILYVFLRVEDGSWRGTIKPRDINKWFESYGRAVSLYADLCENMKLDMLCIGSELTTVESCNEEWTRVIKQVREEYSGPIVYGLNWWSSIDELHQRILKLKWLKELDYIGVDAYFPITSVRKPRIKDATQGWFNNPQGRNIVAELEALYKKFKIPLIFTEIGYRSIASALEAPWDWRRTDVYDERTQAVGLYALFKVFYRKPWVKGFILWSWDIGYEYREKDLSYNVYRKQAQDVVTQWFKLLSDN